MTPTVEGRLLQALALRGDENVLEIGTGSGFVTACLRAGGCRPLYGADGVGGGDNASIHAIDRALAPLGCKVGQDGADFHGAGAVRFDTKYEGGALGEGGERYDNYVRLVRDVSSLR